MSGPIVRKYGFPNFEKIFGERPAQHGVDDNEPATDSEEPTEKPGAKASKKPAPKAPKKTKPK
jgi:hypothetical protein